MKPTPVRRIVWVLAIVLLLGLLMAALAQAQPVVGAARPAVPVPANLQVLTVAASGSSGDVGAAEQPVQLTDDRGRTVRLARSPQRIVSILPSLTESVCALGRCERLVAVDRYSNYPDRVRDLPVVGGGLDPNVEAIVALRPDVVLMAQVGRVADRLEALGVKVVALEPRTHADVRRVLHALGQLLAVPHAERIWQDIDAQVSAAAESLPLQARGMRVYFEVNSGPYAAGATSFIGETLARLRVENIVPAALGPFPKLNPEFVVRARPDLIMVSARGAQGLAARPGWAGLRALRESRVCTFSAEVSDVMVRAGPRMGEAARLMARCLADKSWLASTGALPPRPERVGEGEGTR